MTDEPPAMALEQIHWLDSGGNFANAWVPLAEIEHLARDWNGHSVTVGYVAYESEDRVVLVQTLDAQNPNGANAFLIYKENIIERNVIG
jgi:hypothetical protein